MVRSPNGEVRWRTGRYPELRGNQLVYLKTFGDEDRATAAIRGFGETARDYDKRVENKKLGTGYRVTGDRPLSNIACGPYGESRGALYLNVDRAGQGIHVESYL
jgi:hypothetical protein